MNLPPGVITKMAQKTGLIDKVNEVVLLETINRRLAPKFRELICSGQYLKDMNNEQSNTGEIVTTTGVTNENDAKVLMNEEDECYDDEDSLSERQ